MADWKDPQSARQGFGVSPSLTGDLAGRTTMDVGLRRHMLSIYNYMTSGVLLTGIVALLFSRGEEASPAYQVFFGGGILAWIIILSPLAIVMAMSFGASRLNTNISPTASPSRGIVQPPGFLNPGSPSFLRSRGTAAAVKR